MGSVMAYFCGLYISSDALTPESIWYDLFGLKILTKKENNACVGPDYHLCVPLPKRPPAQLSRRWDTGAPMVLYYDVIKEE